MTRVPKHLHRTAADHLPTVVDRLVAEFQPQRIIMFGSNANGSARDDSDLDLLVVMPDGTPARESRIAMRRALRDLPLAKDILVTTPEEISRRGRIPGLVLHTALREGVEAYGAGLIYEAAVGDAERLAGIGRDENHQPVMGE